MGESEEDQDAALAHTLAEEEMALALAANIELARKLAERPAFVYQEIAWEQGQQKIAQAKAEQEAADAAQGGTEDEAEAVPPCCLLCNKAEHLSEIDDVGHLCFSCLYTNSGVELKGLAFS